jgi:hypothetical protein
MKNGAKALPASITTELIALYNAGKWAQLATAAANPPENARRIG